MANGYKAALKHFEDAVRAHENMGAQHPSDHLGIQQEYEKAKAAVVMKLTSRHHPECNCRKE